MKSKGEAVAYFSTYLLFLLGSACSVRLHSSLALEKASLAFPHGLKNLGSLRTL